MILYLYCWNMAMKLPDNNPENFLKQKSIDGKVVVCIGDSITHGRVGCNYVDILVQRLGGKGYRIVNAGINSELAYNVTRRLDEIISCKPDYVTVLIGTNDANASISKKNGERAMSGMKLPQIPTKAWYRENLEKICIELRKRTKAKIAIISLPPISEEPNSLAFTRAKEYSAIIKDVAERQNLVYLPLNEMMTLYLQQYNSKPLLQYNENWRLAMYKGIAQHILLGKSYDDISRSNGFILLIDLVHLNCTGSGLVSDIIENFITSP
jgi:acyl-CoA thioesterase I